MRRFFIDKENIYGDKMFITDERDIFHIKTVLRIKAGDILHLACADGIEYKGEIIDIEEAKIKLRIIDKQGAFTELDFEITVFQGLPKGNKLEQIVEDLTELGVSEIIPCVCKRSIAKELGANKHRRLLEIIKSAAKQSRRIKIPKLGELLSFEDACANLTDYDLVLVCYEDEKTTSIKEVLLENIGKYNNIAILIGPEGGFHEPEVRLAEISGGKSVGLTKSILRTQTAGVVCVAMIIYEKMERK